jgi:DNA-dependent RNA polymerase
VCGIMKKGLTAGCLLEEGQAVLVAQLTSHPTHDWKSLNTSLGRVLYLVTVTFLPLFLSPTLPTSPFPSPNLVPLLLRYLANLTLESLAEMFTSAKDIMDWLGQCASLVASQVGGNVLQWILPCNCVITREIHPTVRGV